MSDREPGEAYYVENGWSGCAGSAWHTLPPAAKDGWAHAERLVAGLRLRMAEAWDEGYEAGKDDEAHKRWLGVARNPYRADATVTTEGAP
jgi:hypothetical protein